MDVMKNSPANGRGTPRDDLPPVSGAGDMGAYSMGPYQDGVSHFCSWARPKTSWPLPFSALLPWPWSLSPHYSCSTQIMPFCVCIYVYMCVCIHIYIFFFKISLHIARGPILLFLPGMRNCSPLASWNALRSEVSM